MRACALDAIEHRNKPVYLEHSWSQNRSTNNQLVLSLSTIVHKETVYYYSIYNTTSEGKLLGEGRPKWAPEVKWATPITANMVKAMAKIMMPLSSASRGGTMECVACELQQKNMQ